MPKIVIDELRCKGCALCTIACPRELLQMSEEMNRQGYFPAAMAEGKMKECTSCTLCARICPDVAIAVWREVEEQTKLEAAGE